MAETKTINLDIETNLGSLKSQLREAQAAVAELSDKFGVTSKEAAEAAKRAAELKDRIEDAKNLTDAFNPDAKFNALSRSIGGALDGFQAFEGALGLIGVESEDLQKTLLKVQSAMALSQGIQGIMEAKDSFIQLGAVVKNAFSGMTTAAKAFAVTGIGLLITALGLIAANWDKISGNTDEAVKKQKAYQEGAKKQAEFIGSESKEFATLISRLKATNQGTKERSDLIKKINTGYGTTLKNLKDEAAFQRQANEELASYLEYQKAKYKLQANEDLIQKNLEKQSKIRQEIVKSEKEQQKLRESLEKAGGSKYTAAVLTKSIAAQAEYQKRLNDELKEAEKRFENYGAAAQKAQVKVDDITESGTKYVEQTKESAKEDKAERNAAQEEALRNAIEFENELNSRLEQIAEQNYLNSLSEQDKEIRLVQDKYFELETLAAGNADALREIEIAKLNEINDINLKYQQEAYNLDKEAAEKKKELDKKSKEERIEAEKAVAETLATIREQDFNNIQAGLNLISSLFENNKKVQAAVLVAENAVGIAKTIMNTQAANQLARAQGTALAIASGGASVAAAEALVVRNNIGAGISIASQIAATAKGLSALKAGGAPASGSISDGGGGGGVMSPNFNIVGNSGFNQLAQIQQQPIQAYVVSGEVTSAQALDRNRIKNATL